jgi:hypothetical protein
LTTGQTDGWLLPSSNHSGSAEGAPAWYVLVAGGHWAVPLCLSLSEASWETDLTHLDTLILS